MWLRARSIDRYSWERFTTPQSRNGIRSLYDDNDADYLLAIIPFISVWWMPMNWCVPVVNTLTQIEESENFWCLQANNNYYANVTFAWREYALKGTHNTHRNNSTTHSIHSLHMKRSSPENNRTIWIMPALWIRCARATQMDRIIVHDVCVLALWLTGGQRTLTSGLLNRLIHCAWSSRCECADFGMTSEVNAWTHEFYSIGIRRESSPHHV